jgi:hypothetical protein
MIKKRKKLPKSFSHGKKDGKMLIGYTFCVGYTYRADCSLIYVNKHSLRQFIHMSRV